MGAGDTSVPFWLVCDHRVFLCLSSFDSCASTHRYLQRRFNRLAWFDYHRDDRACINRIFLIAAASPVHAAAGAAAPSLDFITSRVMKSPINSEGTNETSVG